MILNSIHIHIIVVEKPRAVRSNGSPSLRRAGSLEAIYNSYLSGKWPTPEVLSHFMVDQTTQVLKNNILS